jgi:hypothetical protein
VVQGKSSRLGYESSLVQILAQSLKSDVIIFLNELAKMRKEKVWLGLKEMISLCKLETPCTMCNSIFI